MHSPKRAAMLLWVSFGELALRQGSGWADCCCSWDGLSTPRRPCFAPSSNFARWFLSCWMMAAPKAAPSTHRPTLGLPREDGRVNPKRCAVEKQITEPSARHLCPEEVGMLQGSSSQEKNHPAAVKTQEKRTQALVRAMAPAMGPFIPRHAPVLTAP